MRISILTPDMSHNCLGRAYLLAMVLQRRHEVEIVGPAFQSKVWEPLAGQDEVELRVVRGYSGIHRCVSQARAIRSSLRGDVLYASKPLVSSYGAALLDKLAGNRPVVVDIDDWQMGFQRESMRGLPLLRRSARLVSSALFVGSPGSYWNGLLGESLVGLADEITVSSSFLRGKFGGTIVWHGRDTGAWDPGRFQRDQVRNDLGIPEDRKVVMFLGTPTPYKGIEDLVHAFSLLKDHRTMLVLVGLGEDSYSGRLKALARNGLIDKRVRLFGLQPFWRVPEFLAMCDLVVIPQRRNPATIGQVPAKVFDAMAMAKPIIATRVSDLPEILDGCGWVVEPLNPDRLAEAIQYVVDHADEAAEMGWKARARCAEKYSWDAVESALLQVLSRFE